MNNPTIKLSKELTYSLRPHLSCNWRQNIHIIKAFIRKDLHLALIWDIYNPISWREHFSSPLIAPPVCQVSQHALCSKLTTSKESVSAAGHLEPRPTTLRFSSHCILHIERYAVTKWSMLFTAPAYCCWSVNVMVVVVVVVYAQGTGGLIDWSFWLYFAKLQWFIALTLLNKSLWIGLDQTSHSALVQDMLPPVTPWNPQRYLHLLHPAVAASFLTPVSSCSFPLWSQYPEGKAHLQKYANDNIIAPRLCYSIFILFFFFFFFLFF